MTTPGAKYLNHFRLDRELARGGMGAVFLGFDESLQRPVAIKVIRPEFAREPEFADRFLREARAQAQIAHSNVVQVYFVGQSENVLYMAMELVDGGSLHERIPKGMTWKEALVHLKGLAEGLREAARLDIIHRDIKPANLLVDRFGLVHLADFGLAAPVSSRERPGAVKTQQPTSASAANLPQLTQLGMVMGSPPYMSPEQSRGELLDIRTDIYALGATFYELMCGDPPTRAQTYLDLTKFHGGTPQKRLSERKPDLPRKFTAVIDRCLERDKRKRFQNYDELIAALDEAAPRPEVPGSSMQRMLALAVDLAVFVGVTFATFKLAPLAGFVALLVWLVAGYAVTRSTPGQWMSRLSLRRPGDAPVRFPRYLARCLLQHGWLAAAAAMLGALYSSETAQLTVFAALAALLAIPSLAGALAALFSKERRTLVDRLTGTQVLVDMR